MNEALSKIKDYLYLRPINERFVEDSIYKEVCDGICLQVIFLMVDKDNQFFTGVIKRQMLEKLNIDEEKLYSLALKNAIEKTEPIVCDINDLIRMYVINEPLKNDSIEQLDPETLSIVVTNKNQYLGALSIFLPGIAYQLYEKIGVFYVSFTSIHEAMVHSLNMFPNTSDLEGIIESLDSTINECYGKDSQDNREILSRVVYIYDPENDKLVVA